MSSDEYYITRCLDGHPDDFRHLVRRYQRVLLAHLAGQLGDMTEAEEIAQETFVRCYFNLSKLNKRTSFFAWMMGTGNRVLLEQQKNRQRRRKALQGLAQNRPPSTARHSFPLAKTIAQLPDFYRELILLRYYGGYSCKEISQQLSMPLGTITKTLSRAYEVLREKLSGSATQECEVKNELQ